MYRWKDGCRDNVDVVVDAVMMNGELLRSDCDRGGCAERNNNKSDGGGGWDVAEGNTKYKWLGCFVGDLVGA